jgi:hypothetical protein
MVIIPPSLRDPHFPRVRLIYTEIQKWTKGQDGTVMPQQLDSEPPLVYSGFGRPKFEHSGQALLISPSSVLAYD